MSTSGTSKHIFKGNKILLKAQLILALANSPQLQFSQSQKKLWLVLFLVLAPFLSHTVEVSAQITPDNTLPENSIVTPNGDLIEITGGTTAGNNLFHSFQDFSVLTGQTAFFNNGLTIENILSRITGNSVSNIDGLIRANGSANLFLVNPNGIIFGENASLDIGGSFVATTADGIKLGKNGFFSASNPQNSQLLKVQPGVIFTNALANYQGDIINQGDLTVGKNLTLSASNLDLQGQLQAGKNLTLQATDTVKIRDIVAQPFIASAGENLIVEGSQGVDIFALNHLDSGFFSEGNLVLRSANAVGGDAHYWSGGSFRIEQLNGSLGKWFSPNDPIIRASGDVSFDSYEGASLHIFAGGSVNIPGNVTITSPDTVANSIRESITLSDGTTVVNIDGNTQPTLDIRAGTTDFGSPGITGITTGFSTVPSTEGMRTSGNINIESITNNGGLVFLTNQNLPNPALSGNISLGSIDSSSDLGGGDVFIDSRNGITVNSQINVSGTSNNPLDPDSNFSGDGGDVTLFANGDISFNPSSSIISDGLLGGNITLKSDADISAASSNFQSTSFTNVPGTTGGDINLVARSLSLTDGAEISTITFSEGDTGNLNVIATDSVKLIGTNANGRIGSGLAAQTAGAGDAGDLTITTKQLLLQGGAQVGVSTFDEGNAGSLTVIASESVQVIETRDTGPFPSGLFASTIGKGAGGNLIISTGQLRLQDGAQISAGSFSEGNGGSLTVRASESVQVIGTSGDGQFPTVISVQSDFLSNPNEGTGGDAGELTIETEHLLIADGARVSAATLSDGDAGDLNIKATKVELTGTSADGFFPSGLLTGVTRLVKRKGGNLTIKTEQLLVTNGAEISALTLGDGDAGDLTVTAKSVEVTGTSADGLLPSNLSASVSSSAIGNGGNLTIKSESLLVSNGAEITVATRGMGEAGDLKIETEQLVIQNEANVSAATSSGLGGSITVTADSLEASDNGQISTSTFGDNQAGNITLEIQDSITLAGADSGIFANTEEGSSGNGGSILTQNQSPQTVTIQDGATIAVDSKGSGQGGSITLTAEELTLDNGSITAETASNQGGNITLNIQDLLSFINSGEITATAGTDQAGGDGGNIGINSDFIVGFPTQEQYQITAEAFEGDGGNIVITTNAIFGAEFFDISASSQFGLEGEISINTPDINPLQGLDNLPTEVVDASQLIAKRCLAEDSETAEQQSEFTITGRGGLPSNPNESLRGEAVLSPEWVKLDSEIEEERRDRETYEKTSIVPTQIEIVQATGWVIRPDGKVSLTAENPNSVPLSPGLNHHHCHAAK